MGFTHCKHKVNVLMFRQITRCKKGRFLHLLNSGREIHEYKMPSKNTRKFSPSALQNSQNYDGLVGGGCCLQHILKMYETERNKVVYKQSQNY